MSEPLPFHTIAHVDFAVIRRRPKRNFGVDCDRRDSANSGSDDNSRLETLSRISHARSRN